MRRSSLQCSATVKQSCRQFYGLSFRNYRVQGQEQGSPSISLAMYGTIVAKAFLHIGIPMDLYRIWNARLPDAMSSV